MNHYHKMHVLAWLGVKYALVCTQVPQLPQVPNIVVVAVIGGVVVADVVLDSWIVLYERNKFSIENSYIVASRTITWFYCMVSDTIETI